MSPRLRVFLAHSPDGSIAGPGGRLQLTHGPGRAPGGPPEVRLRPTTREDAAVFFEHQLDPAALHMAAFTAKDPADRRAWDERWARLLADDSTLIRTIVVDGVLVGHVASFDRDGDREVTYWIARTWWGRGVASRALVQLLAEDRTRPIHGRTAADNRGSIRVLEKCGFRVVDRERGFANARGEEIEELVLRLDDADTSPESTAW